MMLTGDRKKNGEKLAIEVLSVGNCYFCIYLRYVCVCEYFPVSPGCDCELNHK